MKKLFCLATLFIFSCNLHLGNHSTAKNSHAKNSVQEESLSTDEFVENTNDIPLAKHLTKISENDLDFDSVGGSLSSVSYKSKIDLEKIKKFYQETLPQMGWKVKKSSKIEKLTFIRENETLEIEFLNQDGNDVVKFFLESRS